ncbi:MAG: enoyl-CoA hydratase/isomerase family protein [bacterium]
MQYNCFDHEINDGVASVNLHGLDTPPLSELCDEFLDLMLRLQDDETVRTIVISDEGNSFDLKPDLEIIAQEKCEGEGFEILMPDLEVARKMVTMIQEFAKPVIAAVQGHVRESGLGLYLAADIRLASSSASFTAPDLSRGLLPDWGISYTLPRLIGPGRMLELLWSHRTIGAEEAARIGLVDRLIEDTAWDDEIATFARQLSNLPQPAVQLTKLAAQQAAQFDLTAMLSYEYEGQQQCWHARETVEGMAAFLAGRQPVFARPTEVEEE